jgi:transcriptional regulator with XRE-family HTH domain
MRANTAREIGLLVRERRHDLRLSQQELAQRAGVGRPWLIAVEAGHARAELGKLLALFAELGLTLDLSPARTADPAEPGNRGQRVDLDDLLHRHDLKRPSGGTP